MSWWGAYIGIPFLDGGRDLDGLDCWGLVAQVYADQLEVRLPLHEGVGAANHRSVAQAMQAGCATGPWHRVESPRDFDVMVARRDHHSRYPGHVGVMVGSSRVLHVLQGRDVHLERLDAPGRQSLVLGFYRHELVR